MKIGIGASADPQATVERCKRLGVERVFISCASLPGYVENGYPTPDSLHELKGRLEDNGVEVPSATYWFAKWPPTTLARRFDKSRYIIRPRSALH